MSRLAGLWRNLLHRQHLEQDLDDEIRAYRQELEYEKLAAGMSPEQARRAALLELGGAEQVKERVRAVRAGFFLETLARDVRYGLRALRRNPGFTAAVTLVLALGIGANTSMFSVVYALLLEPLPYAASQRLALVYMNFAPQNMAHGRLSVGDFLDWRAHNRAFEEVAAFTASRFDLRGAGQPEQLLGAQVTAGFFSTLQVRPVIGRLFLADEDAPGAGPAVILTEGLWRRRFGGDPGVIGRAVDLNGTRYTVVGVVPSSFRFLGPAVELCTLLKLNPPTRRGPFFLIGVGRLRPGVTLEQAQSETNAIGRAIEQTHPDTYSRLKLPVVPLREALVGGVREPVLIMFGAVLLVLLIAVVNIANLLLARSTAREREMAVRSSLGAGRGRLVRQLLTESLLLALLGGAAGVLLAHWGVQFLRAWGSGNLPRATYIRLDTHVLGFTALISILSGILFGLAPAFASARWDLNRGLREGGRTGAAAGARRIQATLVIAEMALSLVLLIGAGLLLRSLVRLQQVHPGFHAPAANVITLQLSPGDAKYADDRKAISFYDRVLQAVRALPGVEAAAISDSLPPKRIADFDTFVIPGQTLAPNQLNPAVAHAVVSPAYFQALGIPLLAGRYFTGQDAAGAAPVTIISETFARRYFRDRDPIGKRMKPSGPALSWLPYMEIVGVVGDVKYTGLENESGSAYYQPFAQNPGTRMFLAVRSGISPAGLAPLLRREIHRVDADVVVNFVGTLEQALSDAVDQPRFRTALLAVFAGIALALAVIGVYGVMAYSVAQRTHEIGLRMALGASRAKVLRMVLGRGAGLALAGVVLGLAGAFALTRTLATLLFGVSATDPLIFLAVPAGLLAIAVLASLVPAWRATRIDPMVALKYE